MSNFNKHNLNQNQIKKLTHQSQFNSFDYNYDINPSKCNNCKEIILSKEVEIKNLKSNVTKLEKINVFLTKKLEGFQSLITSIKSENKSQFSKIRSDQSQTNMILNTEYRLPQLSKYKDINKFSQKHTSISNSDIEYSYLNQNESKADFSLSQTRDNNRTFTSQSNSNIIRNNNKNLKFNSRVTNNNLSNSNLSHSMIPKVTVRQNVTYSHYNKIKAISIINNSKINKIPDSFLGMSDNYLKELLNSDIIRELHNSTNNNFLKLFKSSSQEEIIALSDMIKQLIKDYQQSIELISLIKKFLQITVFSKSNLISFNDTIDIIKTQVNLILDCDRTSVFIYDKQSDMLKMYNTKSSEKVKPNYKKSDIDVLNHINIHTQTEIHERDIVTLDKQCILNSSINNKLAENNSMNNILKSISKDKEDRDKQQVILEELKTPLDKGIAGWVFINSKRLNIEDAYLDNRFNKEVDMKIGYKTKSILCFPLIDEQNTTFGVIQAINKNNGKSFTKDDEQLMEIFSFQTCQLLKGSISSEKNLELIRKLKSLLSFNSRLLQITNKLSLQSELNQLFKSCFKSRINKVYFLEQDSDSIKLVHYLSFNEEIIHVNTPDFSNSLLGIAYNTKKYFGYNDINDSNYYNDKIDLDTSKSIYTYPFLISKEENNKIIYLIVQCEWNEKLIEANNNISTADQIIFNELGKIIQSISNKII